MEKNNTQSDGILLQRQLVIQRSLQYNLFSDTFLSVALDDIKACEHVLRVILGKAGLKVKKLMQYFKTAKPDDSSQGELSKRVHFLKCEEGGHEIMCKITDMFYQEGVEKGIEKGKEIGLEQGKQKKQHDIAKKMISKGDIPLETIMEYTDLSLDSLKQIQKEILATV